MKICSKCKELKDVSCFTLMSKSKNTLQAWCIPCRSDYDRARWKNFSIEQKAEVVARKERTIQKNREYIISILKESSCTDCGERDILVLHFDHLDRKSKSSSISNMVTRSTVSSIKKEIEKCVVRCANCHARRTAHQLGFYKTKV